MTLNDQNAYTITDSENEHTVRLKWVLPTYLLFQFLLIYASVARSPLPCA